MQESGRVVRQESGGTVEAPSELRPARETKPRNPAPKRGGKIVVNEGAFGPGSIQDVPTDDEPE